MPPDFYHLRRGDNAHDLPLNRLGSTPCWVKWVRRGKEANFTTQCGDCGGYPSVEVTSVDWTNRRLDAVDRTLLPQLYVPRNYALEDQPHHRGRICLACHHYRQPQL